MAAGVLSPVGSDYGPCEGECQHTDCAYTRAVANSPCSLCSEAIGYERRFYRSKPYGTPEAYSHARCVEYAIEQERQAVRS